jgi:hypothetical protein
MDCWGVSIPYHTQPVIMFKGRVSSYLLVRIQLTPAPILAAHLGINRQIVTLHLKVLPQRSPPLLRTLDHTAERAIEAGDELAPDHLQQFPARRHHDIDSRFARTVAAGHVHDLLQIREQVRLHGQEARGHVGDVFALGVARPVFEHLEVLGVRVPGCADGLDASLAHGADQRAQNVVDACLRLLIWELERSQFVGSPAD